VGKKPKASETVAEKPDDSGGPDDSGHVPAMGGMEETWVGQVADLDARLADTEKRLESIRSAWNAALPALKKAVKWLPVSLELDLEPLE
jgi:hypothetical protein